MKYIVFIILCFSWMIAEAQNILNDYIETGLKSNLALIQKESNYRQSLEVLRESKSMFYPSVSLNARYTVSEGGRVIEFPLGDLLNDVYSTLNQLTTSDMFPVLENEEIRFLRPAEHETKVRLVQPVFNTDISFNSKIKEEMSVAESISLDQYRRELITEIKKAYYASAMTSRLAGMLENTRHLLLENVRVNTSLAENDKITVDIVLRSQSELHEFDRQLRDARKNLQIANAYFNFLLNRPLSDSIIIEEPPVIIFPEKPASEYIDQAIANREELKNLEQLIRINDLSLAMNKSGKLPEIMLVADYGFQGERYEFNKDQDYIQASAVLTWDLFSGFRNRSRINQSLIRKESARNQFEEAGNKIRLQVISILEELKSEKAGLAAAEVHLQTAEEVFRLVNRRYAEGQANLIEFMDARNSLTRAEENLIITKYSCLSKYAEFENIIVAIIQ
jgi:outer membrane protein